MEIVDSPGHLSEVTAEWHRRGWSIGLVPTMGALHEGHRSLVDSAREECDRVVVSIFVNPIQFSDANDFDNYPSTVEADLAMCRHAGVDVVYLPRVDQIYPHGFATTVHLDGLPDRWEGRDRPGHFDGVSTVVTKLLVASRADVAFFGQKDFQQCAVVQKLVADLDLPVDIRVRPTVREHDGLALSSRNVRLDADGRRRATALSASLRYIQELFTRGLVESSELVSRGRSVLDAADLDVHYLEIVDASTLTPTSPASVDDVVLVAATCDGVRLIDNHRLT